jgi:EAL domain-containing protein (putative c-di-GMP-specific phosphodiesterase class I)
MRMSDGCEMAQGYYFSEPLPDEAAKGLVMEDASW